MHQSLPGSSRCPGKVRRDETVARAGERIVRQGWLLGKDVKAGPCDPSGVQRIGKRLLVDELTSAGIDEEGRWLHERETVRVDHFSGFRCERGVERYDIAFAEKFIERDEADGCRHCGDSVPVVGYDSHPK